jgi:hypothetical protein
MMLNEQYELCQPIVELIVDVEAHYLQTAILKITNSFDAIAAQRINSINRSSRSHFSSHSSVLRASEHPVDLSFVSSPSVL